jgi:hypothetical protein
MENTKKIIEELENTLEDADGVTSVHGRYYQLAAEYYRYEVFGVLMDEINMKLCPVSKLFEIFC